MNEPHSGASILIVDDDGGLLRLAAKTLERHGYKITVASSSRGAIDWLREHEPDLALLDLKLADATAQTLVAELTQLQCLPPFVIFSGRGDEINAVEMMKGGAIDYVVKNNDFLDLLPSITQRALKEAKNSKKLAEAQQALRLSEERFRVALKHSPVMVFNQDAALRYTWVHNLPEGWDEDAFLGRRDNEIFLPEEARRLMKWKMRALVQNVAVREEIACTLAGSTRCFDLTIEPVKTQGQTVGLTGAALEISQRKKLEEEVLQISDLEQRRIGQDLHDSICQQLAGIELKSQALEQKLEQRAVAEAPQAGEIARHVRDTIAQIRSLARGLSPFIVQTEGLVSSLRELGLSVEKLFNISCRVLAEGPVRICRPETALHLYRIAQEAISNSIKHGGASQVEIHLRRNAHLLVLTVSDNGAGFADQAQSSGLGMRIMQHRASSIGGTLEIKKQPDGGALVACSLNTEDA